MARTLMDIYNRMLERYGPQHWWPAETRFEVMVGAVLTQSAAWSNVEKAIAELKTAGALSPHALRRLPVDQLAQLVYSAGYYNAKARKLKALAEYLGRRFQDDLGAMAREETDSLRAELMGVHGIGEETADDILLYAVGKPAFVIDTYTRRLFSRMELVPETGHYSTCQDLFTSNLTPDPELFGEYHALIVRHAVDTCQKQPICHGCCLLDICPTGRRNLSSKPVLPGLAPST
jgi:endonuclease-3 related protein